MNHAGILTGVLLLTMGCVTPKEPQAAPKSAPKVEDGVPGIHGMLVLGDGPHFLSYLAVSEKAEPFQVILEVKLTHPELDVEELLRLDRLRTGRDIYTFVSEPFVLTDLFSSEVARRSSFRGVLFRGDFSRDGSPLLRGLTARVENVRFHKELSQESPPAGELRAVIFGGEKELFATHVRKAGPGFAQTVRIRIEEGVLSEEEAAAIRREGLLAVPGHADLPNQALAAGRTFTGLVTAGDKSIPVAGQVLSQLYFNTAP